MTTMTSKIILSVVFILLSSIDNVNSQTCEVTSDYSSCSSNSACGCLPLVQFDEIGICAVLGVSCSRLTPCQLPDNTCEKPEHICVHHSRCSLSPLCYPMAMIDQRLCPSIPPSTPAYTTWYTTSTTTTTTAMKTSSSTTTTGSQNLVNSYYSDELTNSSDKYPGINKFYQAIEIMVNTSGTYDLSSRSNMDTYGCLYQGTFNPLSQSTNQLQCNDDSNGNQFRLVHHLEAGVRYTLIVTTFGRGVTGHFTIVGSGPDTVDFVPIYITDIDTTETTSTSTTTQSFIISNYSSELTNDSEIYPGRNKYYEAIEIIVNSTGTYTFTSEEYIDGIGALYQPNFDPYNPSNNLIIEDDQDGGNNQFKFTVRLEAGVLYTLVFTTYRQRITGPFSVVGSGPDNVEFTPIRIQQSTTTKTTSIFTTSRSIVFSNYSSALTINSEIYSRGDNSTLYNESSTARSYYYQAIQVKVNTTGTYTFTSLSNFDTYGYIYDSYFYPFDPSSNLMAQDDDSGGNRQFKLSAFLEAGVPYILVFTTFSEGETGPFSIHASGPNMVQFIPINNPVTTATTTTTTQSISFTSSYSSALTMNSKKYLRSENSTSADYYYEAIRLIVNTTGTYTFTSKSNMDTYGYIYQINFYPAYPSFNIREQDDDTGGNSQFQLTASLRTDLTYILVVTTYSVNQTGPFSIVATGPNNVYFTPINN